MTFQDFDRLEARLSASTVTIQREMRQALEASLLLIEGDARQGASFDTGRLAGSVNHQITGSGLNLEGRVGPSARYGANVEFGRRAGAKMPPVDALIGWVSRHPRPGFRTRRAQAFALARAIARRGIRARPFLAPAYRKNRVAIRGLFQRAGARVVATLHGRAL